MNYTEKYHLPQWVESDRIMMTDFNQMCADIEAGITAAKAAADSAGTTASQAEGKADSAQETANQANEALAQLRTEVRGTRNCRVAWGNYVGTGNYGEANSLTLTCDFKPMLVIIQSCYQNARAAVSFIRAMDSALTDAYQQYSIIITWGDKSVSYYSTGSPSAHLNLLGATYHYVILGCDASN